MENVSDFLKKISCEEFVKIFEIAVVVAFFICWAPFHVQRLYTIYATFPKPDEETHSLYLQIYACVTYISGVLYYVSATTNPILYSIMSVKFREAFKETFTKFCGLGGIQRNKPQRKYSALSKSQLRAGGPESTDSAKDDTYQTTLTYKNSNDSFNGGSMRFKFSLRRSTKPNDPTKSSEKSRQSLYASLPIVHQSQTESKLNNLAQFFECLRKKPQGKLYSNREDRHHRSMDFQENQETSKSCDSCDISNSSLKDVEKGAIEDELGAYINELRNMEI